MVPHYFKMFSLLVIVLQVHSAIGASRYDNYYPTKDVNRELLLTREEKLAFDKVSKLFLSQLIGSFISQMLESKFVMKSLMNSTVQNKNHPRHIEGMEGVFSARFVSLKVD